MEREARALFEAADYYNTCIYQDLLPIRELGQHPAIYLVTPYHVQKGTSFPEYIRLSLICMTLNHRINRARRDDICHKSLSKSFYHFRGIILRSLRENLEAEHDRNGDLLVSGVTSLLLADAHYGASANWRYHLKGVHGLITVRGGVRGLSGTKSLDQLLLSFTFVAIIGNTTSPASNLTMAGSHIQDLDIIVNHYGGKVFSFQMCPPNLFAEIIRINHLRMRAVEGKHAEAGCHFQEARNILDRIQVFSPREWSESKPCAPEAWMLVGSIYQAAVSLYCILSLQSLSVLPSSVELMAQCTEHGRKLWGQLDVALSSPITRYSMIWPLVVLGVQAVNDQVAPMCAFVSEKLPELSYHGGSNVPMVAKAVLERFWASGETRWDACFDDPHAFVSQLAVDMSQVVQEG